MTLDFLEEMNQDTLLDIIKRASIKLTTAPLSKVEVVQKQGVFDVSKSVTKLQNGFNRLLAFNNNIVGITKAIERGDAIALKQKAIEQGPSSLPESEMNTDLPDLGTALDELTQALGNLSLNGGSGGQAGTISGRGSMLGTVAKVAGAGALAYGAYAAGSALLGSEEETPEPAPVAEPPIEPVADRPIPRATPASNTTQSRKAEVQSEKVATKAATVLGQPVPARKEPAVKQGGFGARFADYIGSTFRNVTEYVSSIPERLASLGSSAWQGIQDAGTAVADFVTDTALPAIGIGDGWVMNMVRGHEGTVNRIYKDSVGKPTFGVGHLITRNDPEYGMPIGTPVSEKRVEQVFAYDFAKHKKIAEKTPGWNKANSAQQGAMIDLAFNMGEWWKKWPNTAKALEKGDWQGAASGLKQSKWYNQVGKRARTVIGLITSGKSAAVRLAGAGLAASRAASEVGSTVSNAAESAGNFITGAFGKMKDLVGTTFTLGGGITGNARNLQNWHPKFETAVAGAITEYNRLTGIRPVMTSGFRFPGDQARISGKGGLKAAPGKSRHEKGQAVDFNGADVTRMSRMGILAKYGLVQPFPQKDDVHIQMMGGPLDAARIDPRYSNGEDSPQPEPKARPKQPGAAYAAQESAIARRKATTARVRGGSNSGAGPAPRVVAVGGRGGRTTPNQSPVQSFLSYLGVN